MSDPDKMPTVRDRKCGHSCTGGDFASPALPSIRRVRQEVGYSGCFQVGWGSPFSSRSLVVTVLS